MIKLKELQSFFLEKRKNKSEIEISDIQKISKEFDLNFYITINFQDDWCIFSKKTNKVFYRGIRKLSELQEFCNFQEFVGFMRNLEIDSNLQVKLK